MKLRAMILGLVSAVALLTLSSRAANAATAYYVAVDSVYARAAPHSYAMGRLYREQRMDIQHVDPDGWAYGYAHGFVGRCVWAQFQENGNYKFRTDGAAVSNRCRTTDKYLYQSEFTNGEIWSDGTGKDGMEYTLPRPSYMWDNWSWGGRWGNHNYRGVAEVGSLWKIRYTTNDGGGVMARPCARNADGSKTCYGDWMFIQRAAIDFSLKVFSFRSSNSHYAVAENGGGSVVNANRTAVGAWEMFVIRDLNGGELQSGDPVNIQASNGMYVVAEGGGGGVVNANRTAAGDWERFVIWKLNGGGPIGGGDIIALQSVYGYFVVAEEGGGSVVNANRTAVGAWEAFTLVKRE